MKKLCNGLVRQSTCCSAHRTWTNRSPRWRDTNVLTDTDIFASYQLPTGFNIKALSNRAKPIKRSKVIRKDSNPSGHMLPIAEYVFAPANQTSQRTRIIYTCTRKNMWNGFLRDTTDMQLCRLYVDKPKPCERSKGGIELTHTCN